MELWIGLFAVGIGFSILGVALFYLFYRFNKVAQDQKTNISVCALRVSSVVAYSGVIVITLGLLYLMKMIPWWV